LELQGFKSFCDRTELRFDGSGIVGVVGPNGCGKSNLSDALSWVLGEQSAKSLRGTRMEDVIFAGTRERKPVGMASVTMTMVDPGATSQVVTAMPKGSNGSNGTNGTGGHNGTGGTNSAHLPKMDSTGKPGEVVVTRRLYRSGESEYLIDGRVARLRDIQDIFMGTGLGPESYAIIEQGRIGQILSSRPQDRRAIIEEAAGITKFKTRRRLAEAKLEGAKQNLSRVFDILEEVSRQVNSLKRQASKARRYDELKSEMAAQLRRLLSGRYRMLEREASKTALDLNAATAEAQRIGAEVAAQDQECGRLQTESYAKEHELTEARNRLADLKLEAERTRGRLESQARQILTIEERLTQGESESLELGKRLAVFGQELEAHAARAKELTVELEAARERLAAKTAHREQLQQTVRGREQMIEGCRQAVLRLLGEASTLKNQLAQVKEYLAGVERERLKIQKEEETSLKDLDWLAASKDDAVRRMGERQLELDSVTERKQRTETELADRRARSVELRQKLDALRSGFSQVKARKDSLEEILSHRAYTTEAVKRLFTATSTGQAGGLQPHGVLADFVEVDPAHEKAAEEFLHEELEYVIVDNWSQAEQGINLLRTDLEGRATFLVHPDADADLGDPRLQEPSIGPETGIIARLSDVLKLTNGLTHAPAELLPRLARCFLAENRESAQRLASQYPAFYFLAPDGVCYSGYAVSGGKKAGSGPLALKRELRELAGAVKAQQKEIDSTTAALQTLDQEVAALEQQLESLRTVKQAQEKEALALEHELRKLADETNKANSRLSVARLELGRLAKEKERAEAQGASAQKLVADKEQARLEQEQALEAARDELGKLQAEFTGIGEDHAALRAALAGLDERVRAGQSARARLESQRAEVDQRRKDLAQEQERLGVERARLLSDNIGLDQKAAVLAEQVAESETSVERLAAEETSLREGLAALEESLRTLRVDMQVRQDERAQVELLLVKRQAELRFVDETCRKELNAAISELAGTEDTMPDEIELAGIEQKYEDIKARIEALGPVNPQALAEFQETQQRYDFLNAQRQDLLDSIRDTEKAIHDIDVETRRRFAEAFEVINANFKEMFQTLFGGGSGEMRLTDETNVGESGIEMVASPPGKRLQNVLLLSGGEKALTALALLMGIFKYQPSPFCIFDEVDAPLDEVNIHRLMHLLRHMSAQTQFIVITHAKRTMEAADALYGVTMQEPGVSRLVSVRLNKAQEPPPPPPVQVMESALPA
jgi:chromosome segregation protein